MHRYNNIISMILDYLVEKLTSSKIELYYDSKDGRINSAKDENKVLNEIKNNMEIQNFFRKNEIKLIEPKIRDWFDFALSKNDLFFPINIKSTNLRDNQNDNLNSKLGIYYALTGKVPDFDNEIKWESFFKKLSLNFTESKTDYFFLIINKNNTKDIFWTSLKKIETLTPTGNNLPFQCIWNKNRNHIERDYQSAKKFIMNAFEESIKKRTKILDDFNKYFKK